MTYAVKECFLTLQGEGVQSGSRAVFLRFAGCNLWSGREQDRASAQCTFCDTDFVGTDGEGGGKFAGPDDLADQVEALWGDEGDALAFGLETHGKVAHEGGFAGKHGGLDPEGDLHGLIAAGRAGSVEGSVDLGHESSRESTPDSL